MVGDPGPPHTDINDKDNVTDIEMGTELKVNNTK